MSKVFIIFTGLFLPLVFTTCPTFPFVPGTTYQYYCDDWKFASPGSGYSYFKAMGKNFNIGVFDDITQPFKYALAVGTNNLITLYKNGDTGTVINSVSYTSNTNLTAPWHYYLHMDHTSGKIQLNWKNTMVFDYIDSSFTATTVQYVSFSQSSSSATIYSECPSSNPFIPASGPTSDGEWEFFCPKFMFPVAGNSEFSFYMKTNAFILGLFSLDRYGGMNFNYYFDWNQVEDYGVSLLDMCQHPKIPPFDLD